VSAQTLLPLASLPQIIDGYGDVQQDKMDRSRENTYVDSTNIEFLALLGAGADLVTLAVDTADGIRLNSKSVQCIRDK
jgi:hypothetical protein